MSLEEELVGLERRGWTALSRGEGAAYYRRHLADNAVMAFPFGVLTREQAIEAIESSPPWSGFEMTDVRVVVLDDDSAVVVYSVVARRPEDKPYSAVMSSAFVRRDGEWKLAFHQQTPT